ncbi:MAG TPA: hypothetical protein VGM21_15275, partial [Actinomycetota bacterium]
MSELKGRRPATLAAALLALALAAVAAGCGGSAPAEPAAPAPTTTAAATPAAPKAGPVHLGNARAYVALAATDVTIRSRPGGGRVVWLATQTTPWGSPTPFLVREARRTAAGETWLKVLLPRRPNGSSGWLLRDQVRLRPVDYSVQVDLSARTVRLLRGGRTLRTWRAGV